ncbi:MAG: recombinase family protein, partial [Oscillospiraceae bacterium]
NEFQRLLQDCRTGEIDRVLVKSISRFARNTVDCIETVRELSLLGIAVAFEKENIDTSAMGGEMLLSMLGAAAQEESLSISQNLQWGIQKRMRKGEYITDSTPFGYRPENGRFVIYDPEATVVREIFALYLAGNGLVTIAQKLTQIGIFPSVSNTWHHGAIRYILQNEKYIGDSLFQKSYTANSLPLKRCLNDGQRPQFYASNTHAAIIDRDTFMRAQQLHEQRIETYTPNQAQHAHTFAKVMFCGHCGATLRSTKRNGGVCAWSCRAHHQNKLQCPMKPVCETELHRAFLFMINKLIFNYLALLSPMLCDLQAMLEKATSTQTYIVDTNREITELLTQSHALTRLQTKGYIDAPTFTQRSNEINSKISKLREVLRHMRRPGRLQQIYDNTQILFGIVEDTTPLAHFDAALFSQIVTSVTVTEDSFDFELINGITITEGR